MSRAFMTPEDQLRKLAAYYQTVYHDIECIDSIYQRMVQTVTDCGLSKRSRSYDTISMPGYHFCFDMSTGKFPLLGIKHTSMAAIASELWCFIHGVTDKQTFKDKKCNIWNEWANPSKIKRSAYTDDATYKAALAAENDLGPIYGAQWRAFNGVAGTGDQLQNVLDKLATDKENRRLVVSAWNPLQMDQMALPPCHLLWNVVHQGGFLSLHWHQRSCDLMLGVPFNIASYALLLKLLCAHSGLKPGFLFATFVDFHIYNGAECDHTAGANEVLQRKPSPSPSLDVFNVIGDDNIDILQWRPDEYAITDYQSQARIKMPVAV